MMYQKKFLELFYDNMIVLHLYSQTLSGTFPKADHEVLPV